mgnify:FL=1
MFCLQQIRLFTFRKEGILMSGTFPARAAQKALALFKNDLNCAESVFKALLLENGKTCPLELLRTASAFGRGMGEAGCCCGALVGGEMAIGFFFGRSEDVGPCPDVCAAAAKQLHDRFVSFNHGSCCRVLHRGLAYDTPEQFKACAQRSAEAARIAAEVILETDSAKKTRIHVEQNSVARS